MPSDNASSFKPDIPMLRGESNLERWDTILRRTLQTLDLEDYIMGGVVEPIPAGAVPTTEEKAAIKQFRKERGQVGLLLGNSLIDPNVDQLLTTNG